jgi:hypothetical protein
MLAAHAHQTAANKTGTPQQTQERGEREREREREKERRPKDEWLKLMKDQEAKKKRKSWPVRQRLWASFCDVVTSLAALEQASLSLSLSLSIYIYIHIYIYT